MQEAHDDPLSRSAQDRRLRPEQVERLRWWDLVPHLGRRSVVRQGARLVPLEAVEAGDTQVLAAAEPRPAGRDTVIELDVLAEHPEVESVVASASVAARRPLRNLRELLILDRRAQVPDQETFANLPRLESLHVTLANPLGRRVRLEWLQPGLRELAVAWHPSEPGRLDNIGQFTELRRLLIDAGPNTPLAGFANLRRLSYLHLRGGKSGWQRLGALEELEEIYLYETGLRDLGLAKGWKKLRAITMMGRRLASLDGIEELDGLESCQLDWLAIKQLSGLRGLRELASLELNALIDVPDLEGLDQLPALRRLVIEGAMERDWRIASLKPVARLEGLEDLTVGMVKLGDPSVAPLSRLRHLKRIAIFTLNPVADLDQFRAERPDVEVDERGGGSAPAGEIEVGPVTIHPPLETAGPWWIFQDLSNLLATATNAEAEGVLSRRLEAEDPALLGRLKMDTEAGGVGIQGSEADLTEVGRIIGELGRPPSHSTSP